MHYNKGRRGKTEPFFGWGAVRQHLIFTCCGTATYLGAKGSGLSWCGEAADFLGAAGQRPNLRHC
jgi:hypothetical protein